MPRFHDNGCFFTVTLSETDVIDWARTWPCFGPRRALWFQFDKRNGDLVDMKQTDNDDAGILALSNDAKAWGNARIVGAPVVFRAELALSDLL